MPIPVDPRFPEPIRDFWASLDGDVAWLHGRWTIYRQLFGTSEKRFIFVQEMLGTISDILDDVFLRDVQIVIAKLGDPAESKGFKNRSLRGFQTFLKSANEDDLADKLELLIAKFDIDSKEIRHRRNKWLAHDDLGVCLGENTAPLSHPSRTEIECALSALCEVMNCVNEHYTGVSTLYSEFVMNQDGESGVHILAQAKRYQQLLSEGQLDRLSELQQPCFRI